jgi:hypothetical protein
MAFLEKDQVTVYEQYINQALQEHGHAKEKVVAHAVATIPVSLAGWLLQGPTAVLSVQSCVIAATQKVFLIILTKQDFAETPRVVQSFVLPLNKVELVKAKKGLLLNWLLIKIEGRTYKLRLAKTIGWNEFAGFQEILAEQN